MAYPPTMCAGLERVAAGNWVDCCVVRNALCFEHSTIANAMKLSVIQRSAIGLCFALLLALLVGVWLHHTIQLSMESEQWLDHTNEVLSTMSNLAARLNDAVTASRDYVATGSERDRQSIEHSCNDAETFLKQLHGLVEENPRHQKRLAEVDPLVKRLIGTANSMVPASAHTPAGSLGRHTDSNSRRHSPATARHAQRRANSHARSLGGAKRGHADDHGFCLVGQRSDAFSPQCIGIFDDSRSPRTDQDRANPDGQNATVGGREQGIGIVQLQRFARLARSACAR